MTDEIDLQEAAVAKILPLNWNIDAIRAPITAILSVSAITVGVISRVGISLLPVIDKTDLLIQLAFYATVLALFINMSLLIVHFIIHLLTAQDFAMSYSATRIYIIYMVFSGKLSRTNKHRIAAMRRLAQMMNRPVAIPAFLGYIFGLLLVVSIILFIVRPHYAQITNFLQVEFSKLFNGDYENTVIFGCVLFLPLWEILRKH